MFSWDDKPTAYKRSAERRHEMFKKEVEDRAALLMRLGHRAADVKQRLKRTVAWDFDLSPRPDQMGEVDRIVDEVYKRNQK
jgi:acyl-CoA reductase-like NAD-dependent aldehyde dehydrogenase